MHFLDDRAPISLQTDASDYGVGGYLFQTVDGLENPVAFVSKSLSKTQLRWSVIQTEAYAIYYSCTYLKSLLRDRKFEFSFTVEFIAGKDNGIADSIAITC